MTCHSVSSAFCDYLRCTAPPDLGLSDAVFKYALSCGFVDKSTNDSTVSLLRCPDGGSGAIRIESSSGRRPYELVSVSGLACERLRNLGLWSDFLHLLYDYKCRVTRADVTVDTTERASTVIAKLRKKYPRRCKLSQRSVRTTSIIEVDDRGEETGSFNVGYVGKPKIKAKVYDKRFERLERLTSEGRELTSDLPDCTRYELKFKDIGIPLGELAAPDSLFYHYASPALIESCATIDPWSPEKLDSWKMSHVEKLPYDALTVLISNGYYSKALQDLTCDMPLEGRVLALRRIAEQMGIDPKHVSVVGSQALTVAS